MWPTISLTTGDACDATVAQFEFWSKQDKQAMTAITLETILQSMFSNHGTYQSLSGLECS